MKLAGTLPVPRLTATLLPMIGGQPREVVIHGEPLWKRRIKQAPLRRGNVHHCSACGSDEHNVRRCADLAATKALLKARRRR